MRIALCDDDGAQRRELRAAVDRHLVTRGYRPRFEEYAGGGPLVAEVAAGADPFDLVFLDVYLEGEDGIAVARKLREHDPSVPLVFLTCLLYTSSHATCSRSFAGPCASCTRRSTRLLSIATSSPPTSC